MSDPDDSLHAGQPLLTAGAPLGPGVGAMILVHGRGADASDILAMTGTLGRRDFAYLAPQAAGGSWYPRSFLAPLPANEPWLSSALARLGGVLEHLDRAGVPAERTILLGFSQGACLALEHAARNARRYGAVVGLSGGLIGAPGTSRDYPGSLAGTPVLLGCSDRDPHVPEGRVHETARVLAALGGEVDERIYPGLGHLINDDEVDAVRELMARLEPVVHPAPLP